MPCDKHEINKGNNNNNNNKNKTLINKAGSKEENRTLF